MLSFLDLNGNLTAHVACPVLHMDSKSVSIHFQFDIQVCWHKILTGNSILQAKHVKKMKAINTWCNTVSWLFNTSVIWMCCALDSMQVDNSLWFVSQELQQCPAELLKSEKPFGIDRHSHLYEPRSWYSCCFIVQKKRVDKEQNRVHNTFREKTH